MRSLLCFVTLCTSIYGQSEFAIAQSPPQPSPEIIRFGSGEPVRAIRPQQFQIELPNIYDPLREERPKRHQNHAGYLRHPTFQPQQFQPQQFQQNGHVYIAQPSATVVRRYPFQPAPVFRQYVIPQQFQQPRPQFVPQQQQFVPQPQQFRPQPQLQLPQQQFIQLQQPQYPLFDLRPQPVRPVRPVYIVPAPAPRPAPTVRPFYTERPQAAYGDEIEDTNYLNGRITTAAPRPAQVTQGYSERPAVTQGYSDEKPSATQGYSERPPVTREPYVEPSTAPPAPYVEPTTARPQPRPQPPRTLPYVVPTTRRPAPRPTTQRPAPPTTEAYIAPATTTPRPTPRRTTTRRITTTTARPTTTTTRAPTTTTRPPPPPPPPTTTTTRRTTTTQRTTATPAPTTTTTIRTTTTPLTTTTTTARPTTTTAAPTTAAPTTAAPTTAAPTTAAPTTAAPTTAAPTTAAPTTAAPTTAIPVDDDAVETPKYDETFVGQYYYGRRGEGGNNTFPLPSCFYNPSGYVCCNLMLNELMTTSFEEVRTKTNLCNVHRFAVKLQKHSEKIFDTQFETIVSYEDFSQKIHFKKDLVCKVEIDGRYILAYATPEDVEQEKIIPTVPSREIQKDSFTLKNEVKSRIREIEGSF